MRNATKISGKIDQALEYNDSSSYVYLGEDELLDVSELTIIAWIKPYSLGSYKQRMEILNKLKLIS